MGNIIINTERCKGCELCIRFCPKKLIRVSTTMNSKGHYPCEFISADADSCTGCAVCAVMCPDVAIEVYR